MNRKTNMKRNIKKLDSWAPKNHFKKQLFDNYGENWSIHLKRRVLADIKSKKNKITSYVSKLSKSEYVFRAELQNTTVFVVYDKTTKTLISAPPPPHEGGEQDV